VTKTLPCMRPLTIVENTAYYCRITVRMVLVTDEVFYPVPHQVAA